MDDIVFRPFRPDDEAACLAIFDSNVPTFLAPEERAEFRAFLGTVNPADTPYLVLTRKGSVVACGGLYFEAGNPQTRLSWGLVDRALHAQGLGRRLTEARLALARAAPNISEVGLATSQHTGAFYQRFGFDVTKITPDGLAPGLDRWDMILQLPQPSTPQPC